MKLVGVAILLAAVATAHAEPETGIVLGASAGRGVSNIDGDEAHSAIVAVQLDAGLSVNASSMLGVHIGAATASDQKTGYYYSPGDNRTWLYNYRPLDVGFSAHTGLAGRVSFAAWLGGQLGWRRLECVSGSSETSPNPPPGPCAEPREWKPTDIAPAFGLSFGVVVVNSGAHQLVLTGAVGVALETERRDFMYSQFSIGAAYRFWKPQ